MDVKYRVHEVAKDFKVKGKPIGSKVVTELLTKYAAAPSSHMAVLSEMELSLLFDHITQHNQVADLKDVLAVPGKTPAPAQAKPVQKQAAPAPAGKQQAKGQQQAAPAPAPHQEESAAQDDNASRVPKKTVVNTRKSADVNLDRYDARLDELTPDRAERMEQGKQKLKSNRSQQKRKGAQSAKRRQEEQKQQMRRLQQEVAKKAPVKVEIPEEISVGELASRMKKTGASVVKELMKNGIMASLSEIIDFDTAALIAEEMGCVVVKEVVVTIEEKLIDTAEDREEDLVERAPVIVVMGHVDHGKTSLLDHIRSANVTAGEAGGITQAIGAYQVKVGDDKVVTFLDTPGHEAFTAMRARGAMVTDIAILVVAADDGIMPQTVEAINHAKAAEIPIVVAINKMDLPNANPDRIMQQLTQYGLVSEDWGGDTIICPISAKTGMGIDDLLENVLLVAEMRELKANPDRSARGAVVEARLDKGRGPVATLLVQNGTLKQGDIIIAGTAVGRVRAMTDYRGKPVKAAGPSVPVEITGMAEVPSAGDDFYAVADERMARELAEQRKQEKKDAMNAPTAKKVSLDDLFSQIQVGDMKELKVIVKADVQGSAEAVRQNLEKLTNEEVRVRVIHSGVGAINESDVMLASTSNAIIVGFSVRPDNVARGMIERDKVDVRLYRVIYDCIEEIEAAMKGMLAPKFKEVELGRVEVREVYKITGVGAVAGCYVKEGKVIRNAQLRLVRDGVVIHEGSIASLRRFKDDVKEVATSYECGITLEKFSDIKVGDIFEVFQMEQIQA
ncbi:MAG: translation initiation factor IF-2 [Oscillospiraceae bacterium]|nr:translation initiation factor IF-2 [Oscillospiraceae bacterium]